MAKAVVTTLSSLQNETSALAALNANFAALAAAVELQLTRSGTTPNTMTASLDMNNQTIINLPAPAADTEPARHGDLATYVTDAQAAQTAAETAETGAQTAETGAQTAQTAAELALDTFDDKWLGTKAVEPTLDNDGNALADGAIYFNTADGTFWIYWVATVYSDTDLVYGDGGTSEVEVSQWVQGYLTSTGPDEAPNDGEYYTRQSLGWTVIPEVLSLTAKTDSYILAITEDNNTLLTMNKATGVNVTVPPNTDVAFPIGTVISVAQLGAGQITFVAGVGVTLRTSSTLLMRAQYGTATLIKIDTDEWIVSGDLES